MGGWRKYIFFLMLGLLAIFLQGTVLRSLLPSAAVIPNFLVVLVIFLAFYETSVQGVWLAFLLGLELDLYGGVLLGPWAGAFAVTFCVFALLSQRIFVESGVAAFLVVFVASLFGHLIYLVMTFEFQMVRSGFISISLTEALLNGLVALPVLVLLRRLFRRKERAGAARS